MELLVVSGTGLRAAESAKQPCSCRVKVFWVWAVHSSLCVCAVALVLQRLGPSPSGSSAAEQGCAVLGCRRFLQDDMEAMLLGSGC